MNQLELRVSKLEAAEEIRALKRRYADICDQGYDPEAMMELFTSDAVWDGGASVGRHEGSEALFRLFDGFQQRIPFALHLMVSPILEVRDDLETAMGTWQLLELASPLVNEVPVSAVYAGIYHDEYRRIGGEWRFESVRLEFVLRTDSRVGWADGPMQD